MANAIADAPLRAKAGRKSSAPTVVEIPPADFAAGEETPDEQKARLLAQARAALEPIDEAVCGSNDMAKDGWNILNAASNMGGTFLEEFEACAANYGATRRQGSRIEDILSLLHGAELVLQEAIAACPGSHFAMAEEQAALADLKVSRPALQSIVTELNAAESVWPHTDNPSPAAPAEPASVTDVTWDSFLTIKEGGPEGLQLALECTHCIESISSEAISQHNDRFGSETVETAHVSRIERMRYQRIKSMNSLLMSYLNDDSVTLRDAYRKVYGEAPAPAQQPEGALA